MKKSVESLKEADLNGKKVLVRLDINVPMDHNGNFKYDTRILDALPTIKYLIQHRARVILIARLGHPLATFQGHTLAKLTKKYSLKPLVPILSYLLGFEVTMENDCIGEDVKKAVNLLPDGRVLLLENLRLHEGEIFNDKDFASELASLADLFVNEAFGTSRASYASTVGVARRLKPAVAGLHMRKELDYLIGVLEEPKESFVAVVGGVTLSTRGKLIMSLLDTTVDVLLLGGGIVFTFLKAQGYCVACSLVQRHQINMAKSIISYASKKNVKLLLPVDIMMAEEHCAETTTKVVPATKIPDDEWTGLDIGPETIKLFGETLDSAKTILWIGPMGVYQFDKFAAGTKSIAEKLAQRTVKGAKTIIAGDHTVAAVKKFSLADKMSHVSTGRIASLMLLTGHELPGLNHLEDES